MPMTRNRVSRASSAGAIGIGWDAPGWSGVLGEARDALRLERAAEVSPRLRCLAKERGIAGRQPASLEGGGGPHGVAKTLRQAGRLVCKGSRLVGAAPKRGVDRARGGRLDGLGDQAGPLARVE